jgi:hypothetical protein
VLFVSPIGVDDRLQIGWSQQGPDQQTDPRPRSCTKSNRRREATGGRDRVLSSGAAVVGQ